MRKKNMVIAFIISLLFFKSDAFAQDKEKGLKKYFDEHLAWGDDFTSNLFGQYNNCDINFLFVYKGTNAQNSRFTITIGTDDVNDNSINVFSTEILGFVNNTLTLKILSADQDMLSKANVCFAKNKFSVGQKLILKFNSHLQVISINGKKTLLDSGLD